MASPGARGDGGKRGQCDESFSCCGVGGGQICLCPPIPPHLGPSVHQPTAGPHLPSTAAEQTSGRCLFTSVKVGLHLLKSLYYLFRYRCQTTVTPSWNWLHLINKEGNLTTSALWASCGSPAWCLWRVLSPRCPWFFCCSRMGTNRWNFMVIHPLLLLTTQDDFF